MKWIYICDYCGQKTLEDLKRDSMTCGYCEHLATRMQSTTERLQREREYLDLEAATMEAGYKVKSPWWRRLFS